MRGKLFNALFSASAPRITPAHAGKTSPYFKAPFSKCGSPPRMRGKRYRRYDCCNYRRITPAHAGKTGHRWETTHRQPDHPRACGENTADQLRAMDVDGSPPRMRGKPDGVEVGAALERITPAHAGKTQLFPAHQGQRADHPRACGENRKPKTHNTRAKGSPPRMRGKPHSNRGLQKCCRITPAHAGKTTLHSLSCELQTDHPRACGENCI